METASACSAKVIASSISPSGVRIDTLQLRYPRMVHADFMTHRVFSRNGSSSRAIPNASLTVRDADPYVPMFRKNKAGMQPGDFLSEAEQAEAASLWLNLAHFTREVCAKLAAKDGLNIHKQWVNRPLEWFGFIDVVATSTNWSNFDALRDHPAAQDEIQALCQVMKAARAAVEPVRLKVGEWHLPYITAEDRETIRAELPRYDQYAHTALEKTDPIFRRARAHVDNVDQLLIAMSAARTCRVSYAKHDGTPPSLENDIERFLSLSGETPMHASPLEHQATPNPSAEFSPYEGNFHGWLQFRKFVPGECL
jgi:hypothetical protein